MSDQLVQVSLWAHKLQSWFWFWPSSHRSSTNQIRIRTDCHHIELPLAPPCYLHIIWTAWQTSAKTAGQAPPVPNPTRQCASPSRSPSCMSGMSNAHYKQTTTRSSRKRMRSRRQYRVHMTQFWCRQRTFWCTAKWANDFCGSLLLLACCAFGPLFDHH